MSSSSLNPPHMTVGTRVQPGRGVEQYWMEMDFNDAFLQSHGATGTLSHDRAACAVNVGS